MQVRRKDMFTTIRTEGSILPPDLLQRIVTGERELDGLAPEDYHLAKGERLNEAINRSWNRLLGVWASFKAGLEKLPPGDPAITITRERWLLVLFQELDYGRLLTARAVEIDSKSYPISHNWQNTPIHLVGCRIDLDRRAAGVAGAARTSPHSLLQELLNRSRGHLWGFVSNGFVLRILRDNVSLTKQSYVEFDLQAIMDGEVYADFSLLWLLCHQSRVESERQEQCWLEKWSKTAQEQGTRVMEQLRKGVEDAITAFGRGFLTHPANRQLRESLQSGDLNTQDYYRQLLRLVYRLIFLYVAEDRGLLLDPKAHIAARERYMRFYSMAKIRRLAGRSRGTKHADLFQGLRVVMEKLGSDRGCPELGLSALGSFLWSEQAVPELAGCDIANRDFLDVVRALVFTTDGYTRRPVDYKNLGSEELGSIYESLLELHTFLDTDAGTFELRTTGGSERKTTGSYYTPTSLINCLLDSTLDPVLDEAVKQKDPEAAILNLKVCDPACGSGHFLIAAAHRIAKRLAAVRTGDDEPAPEAQRTALRDVIGRCIYGVDVNEMAVELCKVSLWMEALEPGKPLSFLDHRILCGNSLLGATPALLKKGIPDEAFKPIEGDDKKLCTEFKRKNRQERETGQTSWLFDDTGTVWPELGRITSCMTRLDNINDDSLAGIQQKQEQYYQYINSAEYIHSRILADAWCSAFVWKKTKEFPYPITEEIFHKIEQNPDGIPKWIREEIQRLDGQYQFFHWHLAFPDVFNLPGPSEQPENEQAGWSGGFDVVLGNPPWERVKLQEKEWFASRSPEIANAPNAAARRRMISALANEDLALYKAFLEDRRKAEGESHFVRDSLRYPLGGRGDINTYVVFTETMRLLLNRIGRLGCIVPSGIATDDTTKYFFQDLMNKQSLVSLYDFENKLGIFPGVHREQKFCLLILSGPKRPAKNGAKFVFFAHTTEQIREENQSFTLSAQDLVLINPNTRTCPIFRSRRDAELTKAIYRRVSVLVKEGSSIENTLSISFVRMFDMTNDSHLFRSREQLLNEGFQLNKNIFYKEQEVYLPLYEGKLTQIFDHRYATFLNVDPDEALKGNPREITQDEHAMDTITVIPRFWVNLKDYYSYHGYSKKLPSFWLSFHGIANPNNERTFIATICPLVPMSNSLPIINGPSDIKTDNYIFLVANLNSFVLDYIARQKIGSRNVNFFIVKQLPVVFPNNYEHSIRKLIKDMVIELTYTAWDLEEFARDCGYNGPPFHWNEDRRYLIRCALDAAYFHLYGIERDDVDYIMDTFLIAKRKDEAKYGSYRTKDKILEIYDEMARVSAENAAALAAGREATARYQMRLNPPPGPPMDAEGNFISIYCWDRDNWPDHIHLPHPAWEESLLSAWFAVCQKRWSHLEGDQFFPWDGREAFVYALIPF
ncbi:N-6 DNA methylase [Pelotomaculum terephthalicicum JT]|uniref:Eco57I restriction-modification methylase domain-containing protein n=1 Tax=Pelotomaculum terephthalicicum TaxID=206393 RepID=UPI001F04C133|nr:N-6 DNA methylase [Pelotomaculum terephthalicicum]MCG9969579.1 N-6 DNA methylase [Pelotomaculum terephthalicicum JT]